MSDIDRDKLAEAISERLVSDDDNTFIERFNASLSRRKAARRAGRLGLVAILALVVAGAPLSAEAVLGRVFEPIAAPNSLMGAALGFVVLGVVMIALTLVRPD